MHCHKRANSLVHCRTAWPRCRLEEHSESDCLLLGMAASANDWQPPMRRSVEGPCRRILQNEAESFLNLVFNVFFNTLLTYPLVERVSFENCRLVSCSYSREAFLQLGEALSCEDMYWGISEPPCCRPFCCSMSG